MFKFAVIVFTATNVASSGPVNLEQKTIYEWSVAEKQVKQTRSACERIAKAFMTSRINAMCVEQK